MTKSMREAKRHTTWAAPDMTYEDAVIAFIRHALDVTRTNPFLESFLAFQARVAPLGIRNSLVQTALKLTVPGVPDFYQGTELWDFSMVDPDNRRPVDYPARQALLAKTAGKSSSKKGDKTSDKTSDLDGDKAGALTPQTIQQALHDWHDGRIKLLLTHALLRLRKAKSDLFMHGSYADLAASGPAAARLCAFARQHGDDVFVVAASLFPARDSGPDAWADSAVALPPGADAMRWRNVLDGSEIQAQGTELGAAALFAHLPVAVLTPLR
jgi:(1->4)-alpha-D-glucan 1-alpha-D-glucosylmutase